MELALGSCTGLRAGGTIFVLPTVKRCHASRNGALASTCSAGNTPPSPAQWLKSLWPSVNSAPNSGSSVGATSTAPPAFSLPLDVRSAATLVNESVELEEDFGEEECEVVNGREVFIGAEGVPAGKGDEEEKNLGGYLVQPVKNFNGMGVLLLPDVTGFKNAEIRDFALRTACHGYCVLVADLFRGVPWDSSLPSDEYEHWRAQRAGPPERVAQDIETSAKFLQSHLAFEGLEKPERNPKIAVMGFCFGGGRVLEALARDGKEGTGFFSTGVSFYGTRFEPREVTADIKVPVVMLTGDKDELVELDALKEVARKVPGSEVLVYPGRSHAFAHRPQNFDEDEDAERAFQAAKHWLHTHLLGSHNN